MHLIHISRHLQGWPGTSAQQLQQGVAFFPMDPLDLDFSQFRKWDNSEVETGSSGGETST